MNAHVSALKDALFNLHREDLADLTIEELESLECDLGAWANQAMIAAMTKRAAIRDEELE